MPPRRDSIKCNIPFMLLTPAHPASSASLNWHSQTFPEIFCPLLSFQPVTWLSSIMVFQWRKTIISTSSAIDWTVKIEHWFKINPERNAMIVQSSYSTVSHSILAELAVYWYTVRYSIFGWWRWNIQKNARKYWWLKQCFRLCFYSDVVSLVNGLP